MNAPRPADVTRWVAIVAGPAPANYAALLRKQNAQSQLLMWSLRDDGTPRYPRTSNGAEVSP